MAVSIRNSNCSLQTLLLSLNSYFTLFSACSSFSILISSDSSSFVNFASFIFLVINPVAV